MLIHKKSPGDVKSSEITNEADFYNRRRLVTALGLSGLALSSSLAAGTREVHRTNAPLAGPGWLEQKLSSTATSRYSTSEDPTPFNVVTSYNNFYEFGTGKGDPEENSRKFVTDPWSVEVTGEAEVTGTFTLEDIMKPHALEERVYRLRCVEAWSMVVPWMGFSLKALLDRLQPLGKAKYVEFHTLHRPSEMRGQRSFFSGIDWPYVEGLRLDEAYHPLATMAVGLYGKPLPNQNGAPWRLVVPWKYGFKSVKSIVEIRLTERQPKTTWNLLQPSEYGFYANVNPAVDHPRWSQAMERRLPSTLFSPNRVPTLPFNGYAEEVAGLYAGMDLRRHY